MWYKSVCQKMQRNNARKVWAFVFDANRIIRINDRMRLLRNIWLLKNADWETFIQFNSGSCTAWPPTYNFTPMWNRAQSSVLFQLQFRTVYNERLKPSSGSLKSDFLNGTHPSDLKIIQDGALARNRRRVGCGRFRACGRMPLHSRLALKTDR